MTTCLTPLHLSPPVGAAIIPRLPPSLADIVSQILSQIRHTITALALAFKPPITPAAATNQLSAVSDQLARLVACVLATGSDAATSSLVAEWRDGVFDIGAEISRFLGVLDATTAGSNVRDNPHLAHTGMVWGAIDRMATELSSTEIAAVTRAWKGDVEIVKDAWSEFKEALVEHEADGFADFDVFGVSTEMSKETRAQAVAAKPLLGLHQILHASFPRFLPTLAVESDRTYQPLRLASSNFVAAFDTAVDTLSASEEDDEMRVALDSLECSSRALLSSLRARTTVIDTACLSFVDKWEARYDLERAKCRVGMHVDT